MLVWAWRYGGMAERTDACGMSGRSSGFFPPKAVFAGECKNADIYQELWDSMWSPKGEGRSLIENTSFCGFSASLRRPNHLAAVGGILLSSGFAPIFAELELAGLRHQAGFAGKSPSFASLKS
jgi:hypothetical protein